MKESIQKGTRKYQLRFCSNKHDDIYFCMLYPKKKKNDDE